MLRKFLAANSIFTWRLLARSSVCAVLLLTLSIAVSAYTIVLRDGRQIEIGPEFTLTKSTLTYEIGPGITRTIQLVLVDVAATERANNETAGAFLKHAAQRLASAPPPVAHQARTTMTNRELEPMQRRRIESEQSYERRRIELGLPSIEESRRRRAQEDETLLAQIRARAVEQANDEAYWRERARALRGEIVATNAEINYLRARLSEFRQFPLATHSLITSVLPLIPLATNSAVVPPPLPNPGTFVAAQRGPVWISPSPSPFRGPRPFAGFGFPSSPGFGSFSLPARPFDYVEDVYGRANLSDRLDSLLVIRAGLEARWRELEDQARDAKVPQIWLEP